MNPTPLLRSSQFRAPRPRGGHPNHCLRHAALPPGLPRWMRASGCDQPAKDKAGRTPVDPVTQSPTL